MNKIITIHQIKQGVASCLGTGIAVALLAIQTQAQTPAASQAACVQITVTAVTDSPTTPTNPATPADQGTSALPVPVFSQSTGSVAFGASVNLTASALPAGAVVEYSADNGTTWTAGTQLSVTNKVDLLGRTRQNQQTSATTKASLTPYYQRMLVIGNSIMSHGAAPDLGWFNTNGMAASAPEKDFVHLLDAQLKTLYPQATYRMQSGGGFERDFGKSTYNIDEFNAILQQFKPDLIILRIGENVDEENAVSRNYEGQLRTLLTKLATYGQPVKIIATTSVWSRALADSIMRKVVSEKGYPLVELNSMIGQGQYFASQYANPGVAAHPNDAGMQRIADLIMEKIK
ncbi:SGNH/GDSL hydrolase family protein [Spirosoma sp. KUDC1026]|uniref:SGNH/GDSL hydrolase family protein n=1 Tax=Spirosoma sp. KUDC1026 TaxID=2745947 RepID=UPI001E5F804B|nr:SGNH/GDSL hydrolase family protein [Spirosoma sp. KUDC1026]